MGCRGIGTAAFVVLVLAATASESRGQTPTRVGVMPGYPNAPALLPEQRRPVRPDVPVCVWGNANGGYGATPVGSTYAWSFAPNQNLLIQTDGNLGGTVASDRFICEVVTFVLLNGSPKETVTATLTVDGGAAGIAARSVQLEVIAPEADPLTKQNTDVRIAVEEGLKHLYRQAIYVAPTGSTPARARWDQPQGYQLGAQAFALWAFQNQGHLPVDAHFGEDVYAEWVQMGLDWIFAGLTTTTDLSANRANVLRGATQNFVSDLNGNGVGAQLSATSQRGYEHGIAACAVVASGQPDRLVTHGPKANATYREVVEDAIDWLGANQNEGGGNTAPDGTGLTSWNGRGGWEYTPASSDTTSDMSINSWPYVLLEGAADVFAIGVPDWIKQEIEYGVVKHQAATGLFGYQNANPNNNGMATTAGGLSGLVLVETMGAFVPPLASPQAVGQVIAQSGVPAQDTLAEKRTAALNYVAANWHTPGATNNNPWGGGNLANFYTMWTMARALRLTEKALGIPEDQTLPLTNGGVAFDWETGRELASGVVAAAGTAREGYYSYLVRTQNASTGPAALDAGSWPDATQLRRTIATAMGVLVLTPRVFVDPCPTVVNIPIVQLQPSSTAALPAGAQVVLSGRAVSQAANRPVLQVLVNGEPVDGLDLAGNFFKTVTIGAGANVYAIRAVDACGFAEALHTLVGGATTPEFSDLQDVTLDVAIAYSNTTFDLQTNRLVVTAVATNVSDHVVDAPLLMVVENVTQPSVTLQNADGVTPAGKPYFVFLDPAVAARLEPGQSTPPRTLVFHNPNRVGVVFTKSFKSETNGPPYFVSAPPVETAAGVPLAYQAVVADPNDDVPTFVLLVGPPGFVVDPISGLATWAPTPADLGTHAVSIRAVDGRGGAATQSWNLSVVAAIANRPPLIVSVPVVQSVVGASYAYQALATDPDGDGVVFSKDAGPAGVSVSATGAVAWSFVDPGLHTVRIRAIDPSGAFAQQEWAIAAGVASPNPHAPQILSTPPATAVVNVPFLYQPTVVDPDAGQTVAWSFAAAPSGASVDPATGLVSWVPGASQTGTQAFELRATDSLGAYSAQGWTVVVQITGPNLAPTFQSAPALFVDVGSPYSYQAVAADPEFDPVEYAVAVGPPGLVVGLTSGLVQWPTPVLGAHLVQLRATDLFGAQAYQSYYLQVLPPNHPPVFTSAPPAAAAVGAAFLYDANASDPDADLLTFALVAGPAGMIVAPDSGHVLWTPTFAQAGAHAVTLSVSDGRGGLATQSFGLNAVADNQAPLVTIVATPNPAPLGATVQICVQAGDNVGVVNRTLAIAGVPTPLDAFGCAYWTAPATPGPVALTATAEDASTNAGTTAATLQVVDPNVGAPAVTIHAPVPGTVVDRPTDVVATISSSDPNPPPVTWEVRLRNTRTDAVKTAATGSGYVAQAVLGRLDPTLLCNDTYLVEIVVDNLVYATTEPTLVHVVGDFKLGHFAYQTADLHVPVAGIPLTVTRRYDSLDVGQGDFGAGWSLGLNVNVTDGPADGTGPNPSPQAFYGGTRVYVTRTDGERVSFKFDPQPFPFPFSFLLTPRYTPDDGVEGTLEALDGGETAVVSGGVFFADFGFGGVYNPTRYRYVNGEGVAFEIHEKNGLESVTDAFGNQLVVTPGGIVSSTGAALVFDRDALGRIVRVEAPAPSPGSSPIETHYAYDAAGNLVSFVDPGGSTTTYLYGNAAFPHYLTEIRDPLNRPLIRNVYDAEGRLSAQCGPDGDLLTLSGCSQFVLDPDASVQTTFDNLGVRTDYVLDAAGRTLVKRRWKGGVGYDLAYVYDAEGRVLTQTNPAGDTWNYGYDAEGRVTAAIDPAGRTFAMTYDADGRITSRTDPGGATYAYAYTAQGAISAITTPLGAATQFQYDAYGRATAVLDPVGNAWTFVYGNAAAPVTVVYPDGSTETSSYDDAGRLLFRVDRAGKRVDFAWDAAGRLVQETWDDGRTVTYAYDATGKPTSVTDPDAAVQYAYWNTGLLKETVVVPADGGPVVPVRYADLDGGGNLVPGYDGNGRLTSVRFGDLAATSYGYDEFHQLVSLSQESLADQAPLGVRGARRRGVRGSAGPNTASGPPVVAPERQVTIAWNLSGRRTQTARTTPGGAPVTTTFAYDCDGCLGRLASIVHAWTGGGHAMNFVRDAGGALTSATDAEGAHAYLHDGAGRLLSADHAPGSPVPDESYAYDASENRTSSHLSATYGYLSGPGGGGNRLGSTASHTYAYDAAGRAASRTALADGSQWVFSYDHRGRLKQAVRRDSVGTATKTIVHTYDPTDNRIKTVEDGVARYLVYDRRNPVLVLDAAGAVLVRRLYGHALDEVYAEDRGGQVRWLLCDNVGSIRDVVDANGAPVRHDAYESFGLPATGVEGVVEELKFQARPYDAALGLSDFRARWYEPRTGRFTAPDPFFPWTYGFGNNAPLTNTDPTGRSVLIEYACLAKDAVLKACSIYESYARPIGDLWAGIAKIFDELVDGQGLVDQFLKDFETDPFKIVCTALVGEAVSIEVAGCLSAEDLGANTADFICGGAFDPDFEPVSPPCLGAFK